MINCGLNCISNIESIKPIKSMLFYGPPGTGKTFLAVAMAVKSLRNKEISRIF